MQAAQHVLLRSGMVVLHEVRRDPQLGKGPLVPAFEEETAFVAEDPGFQ
jgi:hypothetical protein